MLYNEWTMFAFVLLGITLFLAGLHVAKMKYSMEPEIVRKTMHVVAGLIGLSFPFLFYSNGPVLVLSVVTILFLLVLRVSNSFDGGLAVMIKNVKRYSLGDIYFPVSIGILWMVSAHDRILYFIPIGILTFADSVAALIGIHYGLNKYRTTEGDKSREGSFSFFIISFFLTHIVLLLFTTTSRLDSLLIAIIIGFTLMLFEAIAWSGLDNLFIPVIGYFLVKSLIHMDTNILLIHSMLLGIFSLIVLIWNKYGKLRNNALLAGMLFVYLAWVIGGNAWMMAPLVLFFLYDTITPKTQRDHHRIHNLTAMSAVCFPGLLWMILFMILDLNELIIPYTGTFACQLAIISFSRARRTFPKVPVVVHMIFNSLLGSGFFAIFLLIFSYMFDTIILTSIGILVSVILFNIAQPPSIKFNFENKRWIQQAAIVFVTSLFTGLPLLLKAFIA